MRIASLMQGTGADFEQRRKMLVRKEMDQAYKKHAKYTEKDPMLQTLENLLSGKTEKEIHEKDQLLNNERKPEELLNRQEKLEPSEVKVEIKELMATEREVITHELAHKAVGAGVTGLITYTNTTGPDNQRYITGGEVSIQAPPTDSLEETIQILEKVRRAALAPASPSAQDLRVAASAAGQIQSVRGEIGAEKFEEVNEEAPYINESFQVDIPERFQVNVERNAQAETVFGKDLEKMLFNRTFVKAKAVYATQAEMVKNSYRSYNEPLFSRTA